MRGAEGAAEPAEPERPARAGVLGPDRAGVAGRGRERDGTSRALACA